ncbi:hypothetical protein TELCIR_06433 [Teladorsagia circumcincta]|uniref:Cysteine rich repeat-containing domain protein n=1 Tax=Teladorsagia circumcincta TaxID=45464 RepID=A0A2G9UMZ8_TELCI|nr:hypothetical protein TELCIR_06433 [Teladorsagia circumcincta]
MKTHLTKDTTRARRCCSQYSTTCCAQVQVCLAACIQPCEVRCLQTQPPPVCIPLCQQTCTTTCQQAQQAVMPCQPSNGAACLCNEGYSQCGGMCCRV